MADSRFNREKQKELNEQHTKILKSLMAKPENKKCADCRRKDPRWASWNLGIFVCIQCSGIHRSIGTHISKVKSADLDTWTPEQIENMLKWGNEKANLFWEYAWPKDTQPSEKNMDNFIRAKYERKQYAKSDSVPDPSTLGGGSLNESAVTNTKISSAAPAIKVALASQSTFDAFGLSSGPSSQVASASQQLFDAFSTPATNIGQSQKSFKESIMSMYASSPSTSKPSSFPQETSFGDFIAFQQGLPTNPSAKPASELFDPFDSVAAKNDKTSDKIPVDAFSSLKLFNDPISSAIAAPQVPFSSNASKTVNLLDDFEAPNSKYSDGLAEPNGSSTFTSNNEKMNLNSNPLPMNDFTDFTSAPVNQSKSSRLSSPDDSGPGFSLTSSSAPLPDHSRVSTGFAALESSTKGTPINFANLPPIEDGWSSFQ